MLIVMKDEATSTLTLIAAKGVHTVLLAATIVLGALVLVCKDANKSNGSVWGEFWSPQGKWEAWQGFFLWEGVHRKAGCGAGDQGDDGVLDTASVEPAEWVSALGREGGSGRK